MIWAELARRKLQFHPDKKWQDIKLWGLFNWGDVSKLIKSGDLLSDGRRENKVVWVAPSAECYKKHVEPLLQTKTLDELTRLAGWDIAPLLKKGRNMQSSQREV